MNHFDILGIMAIIAGTMALFHVLHYALRMLNPRSPVAMNAWLASLAFALLAYFMAVIVMVPGWRAWSVPACTVALAAKAASFAWRTVIIEKLYHTPEEKQ